MKAVHGMPSMSLIAEQAGRKSITKYRKFAVIEFEDFIGISTATG
jgi:hypothetical protein